MKYYWHQKKALEVTHLTPNIYLQRIQTELQTFPLKINWENLIKNESIFPQVIILLILETFPFDSFTDTVKADLGGFFSYDYDMRLVYVMTQNIHTTALRHSKNVVATWNMF